MENNLINLEPVNNTGKYFGLKKILSAVGKTKNGEGKVVAIWSQAPPLTVFCLTPLQIELGIEIEGQWTRLSFKTMLQNWKML